jgi:hypothetical protein
VKKIQSAMFDGIKATLEADAVFLNIPLDLYSLKIDWFDTYQNEQELHDRISNDIQNGFEEIDEIIRFNHPNLTPEEIQEKIERIKATQQTNTDQALERILAGQ